ncbi:AGAP002456-PB-like protein [Anopheles sinensis]|uniref:AGAP002456-PB-like protein n=1 Tax=Anopheles sinensis TaxID=74873 RepID=A0A084WRH0_ANOSI|nr:AGAP002456-PB-like protein [Anopheles sinensis]
MQRISVWVLLGLALFTLSASGLHVSAEAPTEYECRPYIEKAIQDLKTESGMADAGGAVGSQWVYNPTYRTFLAAEVPENTASIEDPIDVTSQEEDDNTAAEELSIEETDAATDDVSEEITPSEEVQEQLFTENVDEEAADSEPANNGTGENDDDDDDDDDDEQAESDKVEVSEENGADQDDATTDSAEEEAVNDSQDQADETNEELNASEEVEAASEENEDSENAPTVSEETASEESANQSEEQLTESQEEQQPGSAEADEQVTNYVSIDHVAIYVIYHFPASIRNETTVGCGDDQTLASSEDADANVVRQRSRRSPVQFRLLKQSHFRQEGTNSEEEDTTEGLSGEVKETVADDSAASDEVEEDEEEIPSSTEEQTETVSEEKADATDSTEVNEEENDDEDDDEEKEAASAENVNGDTASEEEDEDNEEAAADAEGGELSEEQATDSQEEPSVEAVEESTETTADSATVEGSEETAQDEEVEDEEVVKESVEEQPESTEQTAESAEVTDEPVSEEEATLKAESEEGTSQEGEDAAEAASEETGSDSDKGESFPEEDLLLEYEIPSNLRDTSHIYELLNINDETSAREKALQETADVILRDLKRIYDNSIKPLETLYKYRDLSNRHFGDPEIFSKPLVLFMGPWSGGKSTILNYLTHNEYTPNSVRTGAEPSPAYFNILMHGNEPEVLDGTQLAADWTFSGLQKFGQGLLDRLRGQKLPNKLLERVNIVEIPGILEVRKQVSKYFPFNDACQWFIDRADIIFLVYDPSKLDVGPETEAILDQLKGREYQTRILLNKADQVKPEELLRVQSALIWNISPLMSSAQPPVMYTVSLWSNPFEVGAPVRLLQAQERTLLLDLGQAIDKRIENKIASARRFAVRVRNHAKMVDCYLTTYYNQKTLFGNKKQTAEKIIASPQDYHIYEGLSTLTNISRYDLPDPEVYRDFFHLNPLYEFKKLSETCTYFRGCPINKLDVAIAYELPELVGKYKKVSEAALAKLDVLTPTSDFSKGKSSS